jgi:hypothetical protein
MQTYDSSTLPSFPVFVTRRGSELRFLSQEQIASSADVIRRYIQEGVGEQGRIWQSEYAPGGSR